MALKKLMGQNFRAFVGGVAVNEATNCQVTIQGNMEDGSTKDSAGAWNMETMTSKQWSVQVDNVDASLLSLRTLISRFNATGTTTVGWSETTEGNQYPYNRVVATSSINKSGSAILNDLSIQAGNRQTIQVSCQYQGSGPLN